MGFLLAVFAAHAASLHANADLLPLVRERLAAGAGANHTVLRSLTADDYISVNDRGTATDDPSACRPPDSKLEDPSLRFFGTGAVLITKVGSMRILQVWVRGGGFWKVVAEQVTPIPTGSYAESLSSPPIDPPRPPDAQGEDVSAVLAAEQVFREAVDLGKSSKAINDGEYLGIVRDGRLESPGNRVSRKVQPGQTSERILQVEHDVRVRVYDGISVVTAMVFNRGERVRILRVFARRADGWKLVSSQSTVVRPE